MIAELEFHSPEQDASVGWSARAMQVNEPCIHIRLRDDILFIVPVKKCENGLSLHDCSRTGLY